MEQEQVVKEPRRIEVIVEDVAVVDEKLKVTAMVVVETVLPEQNERLPHILEDETVEVGQAFMREFYRQAIEKADLELVMSNRAGKEGKGIQRIGKRTYTFKTRFGIIKVKRIRIKHKADGSSYIRVEPKSIIRTDRAGEDR